MLAMPRLENDVPSNVEPRWLNPEDTADYIGVRVDHLPRLRRAGKLPSPSLHLGPRSPRYDRIALDGMFGATTESDTREKEASIVQAIIDRSRRQKEARGRHH